MDIPEDRLYYEAKPKLRACDMCSKHIENPLKIIYRETAANGKKQWQKRCADCGKKTVFRGFKRKDAK